MSEPAAIWCLTPEGEQEAEQQQHADNLADVEDAWLREADLLSTALGALLTKLPVRLAHDVVLAYATAMFQRQAAGLSHPCEYEDED